MALLVTKKTYTTNKQYQCGKHQDAKLDHAHFDVSLTVNIEGKTRLSKSGNDES